MREQRKSRDQETRAAMEWQPPSVLPDPLPRDGIVHRWIRVSTMGAPDPTNVSKRMREGWEPCRSDDYPELMIQGEENSTYTKNGNIEIGGLILCRMSAEKAAARDAYFQRLAANQDRAVRQNYKREENPVMPVIDQRKTEVSFGSGSRRAQEEKE